MEEELNIAPEDLKEIILQETTDELPEIIELKVLIGTLRQQVQMLFLQILKRAYDAQDIHHKSLRSQETGLFEVI